jgi:sn-glycerol 3-phosphate transport system ATP-binding protein
MTVGDRIALVSDGVVKMLDTPSNVYNRPANAYAAKFIGSPSCNVIPAKAENGVVALGDQIVSLDGWSGVIQGRSELYFGIRPEHVRLHGARRVGSLMGSVRYAENYGHRKSVYVGLGGVEMVASCEDADFYPGQTVYMEFPQDRIHLFDRGTENNLGYPQDIREWRGDEPVYKRNIA